MAIYVKTIRTRLDPWLPLADPELDNLYPESNSDDPDVLISEELSQDGLTKTIIRKWPSMTELNQYLDETKSRGIPDKEKEYRLKNNISKTVIITDEDGTVIDSFDANA